MTAQPLTKDQIRAKIAEAKVAPWQGGSFWYLVASAIGICSYWAYPNEYSSVILSASLAAFPISAYSVWTTGRTYKKIVEAYEKLLETASD